MGYIGGPVPPHGPSQSQTKPRCKTFFLGGKLPASFLCQKSDVHSTPSPQDYESPLTWSKYKSRSSASNFGKAEAFPGFKNATGYNSENKADRETYRTAKKLKNSSERSRVISSFGYQPLSDNETEPQISLSSRTYIPGVGVIKGNRVPGPGTYNLKCKAFDRPYLPRAGRAAFTHEERFGKAKNESGPAPTDYNPDITITRTRAPEYSLGPKLGNCLIRPSNCKNETFRKDAAIGKQIESYRKNIPAFIFYTEGRRPIPGLAGYSEKGPAPCDYN